MRLRLALIWVLVLVAQPSAAEELDLAGARELFSAALRDEQARRYKEGLDKLERVARVRETPAVKYRIAACREGLGQLRQAREGFRAVAAIESPAREDKEIVASAKDRAAQLDSRVPVLTVRLAEKSPKDTQVTVDGEAVELAGGGRALDTDPGQHVIVGRAADAPPFEARVTLAEGAKAEIVVAVERRPEPPPPPPRAEPAPPRVEKPNRTLGYILVGAGGLLGAAAGVVVALREGDINKLDEACPRGDCPRSRQDELTKIHDRASWEGPLALGLGGAAVVAAGLGVYFLLRPARSSVAFAPSTEGVLCRGNF